MKTFYDMRGKLNWSINDSKEFLPLQARVIWKTKTHFLIKVPIENQINNLRGYIVIPRTIYIYKVYLAEGLIDGLKALFNNGQPVPKKAKLNDF